MQLRMSPGGRMRFSRRKRPELPPSSVTVTMAARSAMGRSAVARSSVRRITCSFRPRSSVERPVPPPRATTWKPRVRVSDLAARFFMMMFGIGEGASFHGRKFNTENMEYAENRERKKPDRLKSIPLTGEAVFLGIEQLGEARVFLEERKIFVVARVIAILRAQLDGDLQIGERGIGLAGEAIESGQRVVNVVGLGRGFAGLVETFAGIVPSADVHHRHAALIMFFGGTRILLMGRLHALLGAGKFLLMEERQSFIVRLELRLDERVNQLDTSTLGGGRGREGLLFLWF